MKKIIKKTIPSLYDRLRSVYFGKTLNYFRKLFTYWYLKLKNKLFKKKRIIKLHLGCGRQRKEGFINIDYNKTRATDYVLDVVNLPFPSNSVQQIENYHLIEHISIKDISQALKNWQNVLKPGGKLIMEFPNFDKNVESYLKRGNEKRLSNIFGAQRFLGDAHLWGWNYKRMRSELEKQDFLKIRQEKPQDYHAKEEPCVRIVAYKNKRK